MPQRSTLECIGVGGFTIFLPPHFPQMDRQTKYICAFMVLLKTLKTKKATQTKKIRHSSSPLPVKMRGIFFPPCLIIFSSHKHAMSVPVLYSAPFPIFTRSNYNQSFGIDGKTHIFSCSSLYHWIFTCTFVPPLEKNKGVDSSPPSQLSYVKVGHVMCRRETDLNPKNTR